MGTGALTPRVQWLEPEADHSPPFNAEDENAWSYTSTPPVHLNGMMLS